MSTNSVSYSNTTLDVQSIVAALNKSQDAKINRVQAEQKSYEVKISQLGQTKSSVDSLKSSINKINNTDSNTVTQDSLKTDIKSFVQNYNSVKSLPGAKNLNSKIRAELDPNITKDLGISIDKTGVMSFDETKYNSNYTANSVNVIDKAKTVFDNVISKPEVFNQLLDPVYGSLKTQTQTYQKIADRLQNQTDNLSRQKNIMTQTYTAQMNNLQNYLNNMTAKQNSLSNLLGTA